MGDEGNALLGSKVERVLAYWDKDSRNPEGTSQRVSMGQQAVGLPRALEKCAGVTVLPIIEETWGELF